LSARAGLGPLHSRYNQSSGVPVQTILVDDEGDKSNSVEVGSFVEVDDRSGEGPGPSGQEDSARLLCVLAGMDFERANSLAFDRVLQNDRPPQPKE